MHDVFLSYSHQNRRAVERIVADLQDHGIDVWFDVLELNVGDSVNKSIEAGIKNSRFFCFAISPAALRSYYVSEVEFEQAFSRSIDERRGLILPIVVQRLSPDGPPVPERIRHLARLDLSNRRTYAANIRRLVDRIRGVDSGFTGERWYKGLNISNFGEPAGVGPTAQMATLGSSYRMSWQQGVVTRVDVFQNGSLAHYKEFEFDALGRVVVNKMFTRDAAGGWEIRDDVWYYEYDPETGTRSVKIMRFLGEATARVVRYDKNGKALREDVVTEGGGPPDRHFPYSSKIFQYDEDGNPLGAQLLDENGAAIPAAP